MNDMNNNEQNKMQSTETPPEQPKKTGGLYSRLNVSVKTMNIVIAVSIVALLAAMAFLVKHNGFTVTFDTNGGSYVESVKVMYGETVPAPPKNPVKEGYTFNGWYLDRDCTSQWDMEKGLVNDSFTLFAGWTEKSSA